MFEEEMLVSKYNIELTQDTRGTSHTISMSGMSFYTFAFLAFFAPKLLLVLVFSVVVVTNENIVESVSNLIKGCFDTIRGAIRDDFGGLPHYDESSSTTTSSSDDSGGETTSSSSSSDNDKLKTPVKETGRD